MPPLNDDDLVYTKRLQADIELLGAAVGGLRQRAAELVTVARAIDDRAATLEDRIGRLADAAQRLRRR